MARQKACKKCKFLYEGSKCPKCGAEEGTDSFKGRVIVLKPEESEIAKNLGLKDTGSYAVKA